MYKIRMHVAEDNKPEIQLKAACSYLAYGGGLFDHIFIHRLICA